MSPNGTPDPQNDRDWADQWGSDSETRRIRPDAPGADQAGGQGGEAGRNAPRQYFPGETEPGMPDGWQAPQQGPGFGQGGYAQGQGFGQGFGPDGYPQAQGQGFGPGQAYPDAQGFGPDGYPQGYDQGYSDVWASGGDATGAGSGKGRDRTFVVLCSVAGVLLVAVVALVLWLFVFSSDGDDPETDAAANTLTSQENSESASAPSTAASSSSSSSEEAGRPTDASVPSDAWAVNEAAKNNEPSGDFNNVYAAGPTSEPFALAVRDAFVDAYLDNGRTDQTIDVRSSVTGRSYTMNCKDNGSYVHCTGGNNANVYIS